MPIQQVKSEKSTLVRSPSYLKTQENEFAGMIKYMVDQIVQRFENQVLNKLHVKTINKFEDQTGNYAVVYNRLVKQFERKIKKQFSDPRIEDFSNRVTKQANKSNQRSLYTRLEKKIGIDMTQLIQNERLSPSFNALQLETSQWVKKLRDDAMEEFSARTLQNMTLGKSFDDILKDFKESAKPKKNNAEFLARNQIQNFNSLSTKLRAQNLGIEDALWVTAEDDDVRPCHAIRNGKKFKLTEGLYSSCDGKTLLPGVDFNCRCTYDLIIPTE